MKLGIKFGFEFRIVWIEKLNIIFVVLFWLNLREVYENLGIKVKILKKKEVKKCGDGGELRVNMRLVCF